MYTTIIYITNGHTKCTFILYQLLLKITFVLSLKTFNYCVQATLVDKTLQKADFYLFYKHFICDYVTLLQNYVNHQLTWHQTLNKELVFSAHLTKPTAAVLNENVRRRNLQLVCRRRKVISAFSSVCFFQQPLIK